MSGYNRRQTKRPRMDSDERHRSKSYYDSYNPKSAMRGEGTERPNHILLMTILNPAYPITVDVIHTITSPYGKIRRVMILKKNGVQAMVEFDTLESANKAMQSLNGADIYSGCCTLKIEYGKPAILVVTKNDSYSWDYTNPNPGKIINRPPLLQDPVMAAGPRREAVRQSPSPPRYHDYGGFMLHRGPGSGSSYGSPEPPRRSPPRGRYRSPPRERYDPPPPERSFRNDDPPRQRPRMDDRYGPGDGYGRKRGRSPPHRGSGYSSMSDMSHGAVPQPGSVVMLYDLNPDKLNCNKIFNLFCLFGNVLRVKFLQSKEGCAMVQMGDAIAVERAIGNLNNCILFGCKIRMDYSKQSVINVVRNPFDLPDGTPSFRDYVGNRNNRFTNPKIARKNRIQPPARVLHFFNAPSDVQEVELQKVFDEAGANIPKLLQTFPSKNERSSSGLLEFKSVTEAVEGLVLCNHKPLPNPNGKFPFTLKLCFSSVGNRYRTDDESK